jgi:cytosine/adenosine deaminase-related metal-dependent hydrolase
MIEADLLIAGASVVTMDAQRRVIMDGSIAIKSDRIAAVGRRQDLAASVRTRRTLDARHFVATPGFVDAHCHITGDPLTRGLIRGRAGDSWEERLFGWVIPLFRGQTPQDEAIAAQCAALAMMRAGTTCFLEAGTVSHLDAVMEALAQSGMRGRLGQWVEGRTFDPAEDGAAASRAAIAVLEAQIERYPDHRDARLAAWPILVGHATNSDDVWRAAKTLADANGLGVSAHMSPYPADADWYEKNLGRRPLEHLSDLGVLGPNVSLTHLVHINEAELGLLAGSGANAIHCPVAAGLGGYGLAAHGRFPEMMALGVNVALGTDGTACGVLTSARAMAGHARDARQAPDLLDAGTLLERSTLGGAHALGLTAEIGSLEIGKKADLVLHDTRAPEWGGPLFDVATQLAFCAPARCVHSVFIDGVQVIDDGRATWVDEALLAEKAQGAARALIGRLGLPVRTIWPQI